MTTPPALRVLISAGEVSGDIVGARIAAELAHRSPGCILLGLGGERMAAAGVDLVASTAHLGSVGITEAFAVAPQLLRCWRRLRSRISKDPPCVALLIANDAFHMLVARRLRRLGVPTIVFFPPQVWVWRGLARFVAGSFDQILASFPDEQRIYAAAGGNVSFVGHHLADDLSTALPDERARARQAFGFAPGARVVGVLPGSRAHEIRLVGPALLGAVALLARRDPDLRFALPAANDGLRDGLASEIRRRGLDMRVQLHSDSLGVMRAADVLLIASGTATLEATLLGIPMVIAYRLSALSTAIVHASIALGLIHDRVVGIPNIVLGRVAVPELLHHQMTGPAIAAEAWALLTDPERRRTQRAALAEVASRLAGGGTIAQVADAVIARAGAGSWPGAERG